MTTGSTFPLPRSEDDSQAVGIRQQGPQGATGYLTFKCVLEVRTPDEVMASFFIVSAYLDPVPVARLAKT